MARRKEETKQLDQLASVCAEAQRLERRREISRISSRKSYYKNLEKSRKAGAARARKARALLKPDMGKKRSPRQRLERRQAASRDSSMKHYYKYLAESRKKGAARTRKCREKKQRELEATPSPPLPALVPEPLFITPLGELPCSDGMMSTNEAPTTSLSRFQQLVGYDSSDESERSQSPPPGPREQEFSSDGFPNSPPPLPALPPSPMLLLSPFRSPIRMAPIRVIDPVRGQRRGSLAQLPSTPLMWPACQQILRQYTEDEQRFLSSVWWRARDLCDRYGGLQFWNMFWERAYNEEEAKF
ncbi:hypothetical protein DFP72DRAFT_845012 [Ephemerocybe angulata]|uniref:Uncharacterized protein n=1 Tax=Ephemerocybe angulata TaxID=980116 RepID=A0A8H6I4B6_9AGAR|nr:hypothetical protein DFP72DRAFT_845012 [Tulosesus angulatus]